MSASWQAGYAEDAQQQQQQQQQQQHEQRQNISLCQLYVPVVCCLYCSQKNAKTAVSSNGI